MNNNQKRELRDLADKIEKDITIIVATKPEDTGARDIMNLAKGCQELIREIGIDGLTIEDRVKVCLAQYCKIPIADIKEGMDIEKDLGMDSLDQVTAIMDIEEEFGIDIPDEQAGKITTVKGAIELVREHGE